MKRNRLKTNTFQCFTFLKRAVSLFKVKQKQPRNAETKRPLRFTFSKTAKTETKTETKLKRSNRFIFKHFPFFVSFVSNVSLFLEKKQNRKDARKRKPPQAQKRPLATNANGLMKKPIIKT